MIVEWSYDFESCKDMEECLGRARKNTDGDILVSCIRDEIDFDAVGGGEGPYICEITFYKDEPAGIYERPESASWDELVELMDRFSRGEDFSFVRNEWKLSREVDPMSLDELKELLNQEARRRRIRMGLVVLVLILVLVFLFLLRFYL